VRLLPHNARGRLDFVQPVPQARQTGMGPAGLGVGRKRPPPAQRQGDAGRVPLRGPDPRGRGIQLAGRNVGNKQNNFSNQLEKLFLHIKNYSLILSYLYLLVLSIISYAVRVSVAIVGPTDSDFIFSRTSLKDAPKCFLEYVSAFFKSCFLATTIS